MQQIDVSSIASIEDVDSFIDRNSGDSWTTTQFKLNPFETRFWGESVAHRRLLLLKSLYRAHPAVDKQFNERRTLHMLQATSQPSPVHLYAYEKLFSQINRELGGCFGGGQVKRFLDLGCSPGGFSTWLLKSNGYGGVQGVGVTLPDEEARFPLQIDPVLSATALSYRVLFGDVMKLSMEAIAEGKDPIVPLGESASGALIDAAQYDLIIGNAFPTLRGPTRWWLRVQLVLSQILIMITNVAQGGSCIVTINTKPFLWVVDAIGLLQKMFDTITPFKGTLHASRTVGYLICRGFRATPEEVDYYAGRVRVVLRQLDAVADGSRAHEGKLPVEDSSDDDGEQLPQEFLPEALPLLTGESAAEIFDAQHRLVLDLFEPMWKAQFDAIHRDFEKLLSGQGRSEPRGFIRRDMSMPLKLSTSLDQDAPSLRSPASPTAQPWRLKRHSTTSGVSLNENGLSPWAGIEDKHYVVKNIRDAGFDSLFGRKRSQTSAADSNGWWRAK